jgi:predicted transcriptional regulator
METESTSPRQKPVTLSFPPDLIDRLDAVATEQERSRSWITARALKEYLAHQASTDPNKDVSP